MKTFDEALATVVKADHDIKYADSQAMFNEHLANKDFVECIDELAEALIDKVKRQKQFDQNDICEYFHRLFLFGLLVGMEMEREELDK